MVEPISTPGCSGCSGLQIIGIVKRFGEKTALQGVSFEVKDQEIVGLLGPSGCGKSTALAVIAGLEPPDQGSVYWDGSSLKDVPTHKRGFGLMFQDFALFPHQNAFENVAYGLIMQGAAKGEIKKRVDEVFELVGLPGFGHRDVNTLSGGEAQRVALGRALAPRPRLLMLDEPLGALDRNLRERLIVDLRSILRESRQTAIYVTHDQEEAFTIADRIILMNAGQVVQTGTPGDIYKKPLSAFVARFLGMDNLMHGKIVRREKLTYLETPIGDFLLKNRETKNHQRFSESFLVLLRPDAVQINGEGGHIIRGIIRAISFRGSVSRITIDLGDLRFNFDFPTFHNLPAIGEELELTFDPDKAIQILDNPMDS